MDTSPEARVTQALMRFPEVRRVWLFGSRARGDNLPRADIDIAIECDPVAVDRWLDIREGADASSLYKIDLLRLDDLAPEFRDSIRAEGRVLYERG